MHHYSEAVVTISASRKDMRIVWHKILPEHAAEFPFLMHGLLALSASHLRYERPHEAQKWALLVSHHQNLALPAFRAELSKLSENNCKALFAMAAICALIAMATAAQGPDIPSEDENSTLDDIVQMFVMLRGVWTSLSPLWHILVQPPFNVIKELKVIEDYSQYTLPSELSMQIEKLTAMCHSPTSDAKSKPVYLATIEKLEQVYKDILCLAAADKDEMGLVFKWGIASQPAFTSLVTSRDPLALIILSHYIILLGSLKKWFVDGLSTRGWQAIVDNLPESAEISSLLEWPKRQLEENFPAFSIGKLSHK
jgi:hypothetical protein